MSENMKSFGIKRCFKCGKEYFPTSGRQKYCLSCIPLADKEGRKAYELGLKYGISQEEYDLMLLSQDGKCAVCGKENSGRTQAGEPSRMAVDHDHTTGKIRGLLCYQCNIALGMAHDDPALLLKLAAYLN